MAEPAYETPPAPVLRLSVQGMTCAGCAGRVERALRSTAGVVSAQVNLASERASVAVAGDPRLAETRLDDLVAAVKAAGYEAQPAPTSAAERRAERAERATRARRELALLLAAAAFTLPLVMPMVLMPMGIHAELPGVWQLALAAPVQVFAGARFYRGGWAALRAGTANMDVLVALGTTAAFGLSLWALAAGEALYFESAATVITLVLLGKHLERRAKHSTAAAIESLIELQPATARLERTLDGEIELVDVPVETVGRSDVVVVRPGERIPVDGRVLDGRSSVDESLISGESRPVTKAAGQPVTGGSINGDGRLRIEATAVGEDSTLARIVALVERAQSSRAPIQRVVDRVTAVFVPAVLAVAALTLGGWWIAGVPVSTAIIHAVSVLVIACPCALGLATPAALMVGTGVAARAGILIRDAEVLERMRAVTHVVFDKTGTLTSGEPEVVEVFVGDQLESTVEVGDLLAAAAAVGQGSEHPLAAAIVREARQRRLRLPPADDMRARPGRGMEGTVDGARWRVGSPTWLEAPADWDEPIARAQDRGTVVLVAREDAGVLGFIAVADPIRPGAAEAVARLRARGVQVSLLSGDNARTAGAVAREIGIAPDHVFAETLPEQKAETIAALRERGEGGVAMVGDGVNDAPALAAADVGVAMGSGTDVAVNAAGVTLMRGDPGLVAAALDVGEATHRKIRQNLFWAFIFNAVGLPLAAAGQLTPMIAGAAMAASSVTVVTNALLLRRWSPR